ncbi:MAG: hybrid sensor histidine kinase/response regulator, partial [Desulfobacterium sp.]|nr:hybrid sensor histidine kinase/response regulator [Desulfobacterium sp.]
SKEAVDIFRDRHRDITVVLLDMLMPKMSGKETYLEIKKIDPNLKVLFSSGFKQDERVEEVLQLGVQGFVQKPYTLQVLSKAIQQAIQSNDF